MITSKLPGICAFLSVWFAFYTTVCLGDPSTCDKWALIAKTMTGDGRYHTCTSNATSICTRYDCEGSLTERIPQIIDLDYCFGVQINSCLEPLSMDFYLKVPSQNFSTEYRITHDKVIDLSDNNFPVLKNLPVHPLLDFELERDGTEKVLISITFKVRSTIGPIYFDRFERKIVDEEEVPLMPCSGPLTKDTTGKPADDFMSVPCHTQKYPSIQPEVITPSTSIKPSETLNKTCDFVTGCAQGETCEMAKEGNKGKCVCEPDYHYVDNMKVCVSQGSVGLECQSDAECGLYEECQREPTTKSGGSGKRSCLCEESYSWDKQRRLCILDKHEHHHSKDDDDHQHHTPSMDTSTTTEKPSNHSGVHSDDTNTASSNTKYIIIAASAVGGVIVVAVVVAALLLCRHRRRNRFPASGGGLYDSSDTPMLADTDDDVDLVM